MVCGHVGLALTVIGIAFSHHYSVERDLRMKAGDSVMIHSYRFLFEGVRDVAGPNWHSARGTFTVERQGKPVAVLNAEKRFYNASGMVMTEAAIDAGLTRDLYAALGDAFDDGSWAVRLYYKPFMRWIGYGGMLMAAGGVLCLFDRRYRFRHRLQEAE